MKVYEVYHSFYEDCETYGEGFKLFSSYEKAKEYYDSITEDFYPTTYKIKTYELDTHVEEILETKDVPGTYNNYCDDYEEDLNYDEEYGAFYPECSDEDNTKQDMHDLENIFDHLKKYGV